MWRIAPLAFLFYSFLLFPPEASFTIGGLFLPSYRLAILLLLPVMLIRVLRMHRRPLFADACVVGALIWMLVSFVANYGLSDGITRGAAIVLDAGGGYFIARGSFASLQDLRRFLVLIAPGLGFAGIIVAAESLSGQLFYRPIFASIFGSLGAYSGGEAYGSLVLGSEYRMGFLRGFGPFSHPILAGSTLAIFLPLYVFSQLRSWPKYLGVGSAILALFSWSSAAFLGLIVGGAALATDWSKRKFFPVPWQVLLALGGLGLAIVQLTINGGLLFVIARLSFSASTTYYRELIWRYGSASVADNPIFGIGYRAYERLAWMPETVDAHFLNLAIRHGLAVPVLLLLASVSTMLILSRGARKVGGADRNMLVGYIIAIATMLIIGQTVFYFGSSSVLIMSLIGGGAALAASTSQGAQVVFRKPVATSGRAADREPHAA